MQLMPKGIRVNAVARELSSDTSSGLLAYVFFADHFQRLAGPVYTPLQPASRTGEQMDGWGIGDIPLHGRVAQPAEMGELWRGVMPLKPVAELSLFLRPIIHLFGER